MSGRQIVQTLPGETWPGGEGSQKPLGVVSVNGVRPDPTGNISIPPAGSVPSTPTGPAGGDLSGTYPNPTVVAVQGEAWSPAPNPPADTYVPVWDADALAGAGNWQPAYRPSTMLTLPFGIADSPPAGQREFTGAANYQFQDNVDACSQMRVTHDIAVLPATNRPTLQVQWFNTVSATWIDLTGVLVNVTAAGLVVGNWVTLDNTVGGPRQNVNNGEDAFRLTTLNGDGSAMTWGTIQVQKR